MTWTSRGVQRSVMALAIALPVATSWGSPITGPWVVTNGNEVILAGTENTNSPVLAPVAPETSVSGNTVQSPFPAPFTNLNLTNVGDYVEVEGTINLTRTANLTSANRLNDQLRVGLFGAPLPPAAGSSGDPRGFIAEYGTGSPAGDIRALIATQANPFSGGAATPVIVTPAGADPEGNFLSGTPASLNFVMRVTRRAGGAVEIIGNFSGVTVDPLDNDYLQVYSVLGHTPDPSFNFSLNRIAILIGGNSDASEASLSNVFVRSNLIPEPATATVGLVAMMGLVCVLRHRRGACILASDWKNSKLSGMQATRSNT